MFIILLMSQLVDRKDEMDCLKEIYHGDGSALFILYGRRRTGKTRLLIESLKGENGLYYMAIESTIEDNLKSLSERMSVFLGDGSFSRIRFNGFEDLLSEFVSRAHGNPILIIDEFPYMFKFRPALLSELQRVWDQKLKNKGMKLVLCGSSISMMEQKLLSRSSPLYGRREGQWKLEPLPPGFISAFLPSYGMDDIVRTYSVCDGIPEYILKFRPEKGFEWNLDNRVLKKGRYLSEEGSILLLQELNNIGNYVRILETISLGKNRQKEIAESTGMDKGMVSKYLHNLVTIGYLEYISPFGARRKSRMGMYVFSDNYMDFYFRFIYPNSTELQTGILGFDMIKEDFNTYMGRTFEKLVRLIILRTGSFKEVAPWWHGEDEIDIICRDERRKELLIGDIKWRNRQYSGADLSTFMERCGRLSFKGPFRKRVFIVSRKGFRRNIISELDDEGILHFDLERIGPYILDSRFDPREGDLNNS
ncbi:MAG TPA: ATP-binding protein [Euryarchaeota archaeon]|nr:ATP-binding protein [Euryarchaeota archaeon]